MVYTLKLSQRHFSVLQRIAWGYDASTGETLQKIIEDWVSANDTCFICEFCKDQSFCPSCFMKRRFTRVKSAVGFLPPSRRNKIMLNLPKNKLLHEETLEENLVALYDNVTEFCAYCSFLCDSFASIAAQQEVMDKTTARGISLCSNWMKKRVENIKDEVGRIHKKVASG